MSLYDENVAKGIKAGGIFLLACGKVIAYPVVWCPDRKACPKPHTFLRNAL